MKEGYDVLVVSGALQLYYVPQELSEHGDVARRVI